MNTQTKSIAWSYPTSINATRFKFNKTGCYTVGLATGVNTPEVAIAGFATFQEAKAFANARPEPWSKWTMPEPKATVKELC